MFKQYSFCCICELLRSSSLQKVNRDMEKFKWPYLIIKIPKKEVSMVKEWNVEGILKGKWDKKQGKDIQGKEIYADE